MSIIELIQHVGEENVMLQRVDQSIVSATNKKGGICNLVIETNQFNANDLFALSSGERPRMHGIIVWLPSDKLPLATQRP